MAASKTGRPNWARGRSAATDPRIARNAASRVGRRRAPYRLRARPGRLSAPPGWSGKLAYAVGLIATDGCLTERHINLTSTDRELIETFLACLGRTDAIGVQLRQGRLPAYRVQFGDRVLYDWLVSIGVTRRKSLTLGGIAVPQQYLFDLVRGLLDGDGSVSTHVYQGPNGYGPYEALRVLFHSASRHHIDWLWGSLKERLGIGGSIQVTKRPQRSNPLFALSYGKREGRRLLAAIYSDEGAPRLVRKWRRWVEFEERHAGAARASLRRQATSLPTRAACASEDDREPILRHISP